VSRTTTAGRFATTYQFLESDLRSAEHWRTSLHHAAFNFSRTLTPNTVASVEADVAQTSTHAPATIGSGDSISALFPANQFRSGIKAAVTHHRKSLTLSLDGTQNWFRDKISTGQNTSSTGFGMNSQWQPSANFQLVASYGINGVNGDSMFAGSNHSTSIHSTRYYLATAGVDAYPDPQSQSHVVYAGRNEDRRNADDAIRWSCHVATPETITIQYVFLRSGYESSSPHTSVSCASDTANLVSVDCHLAAAKMRVRIH
jgi:hypothetical protein